MTQRLLIAVSLLASVVGLSGCGYTTPDSSQEVDVTGTVTNASGAPVKDVEVQFQATGGTARQATFKVGANGTFSGKMTVGKYTYYFTEISGKTTAFNSIPTGYRQAIMDRTIEVKASGPIELKLQ